MNNFFNFYEIMKSKLEMFIRMFYDIYMDRDEFIERKRMRNRILECFYRANRAYREITKYKAPMLITERQLQELLCAYASSQQLVSYKKLQEDIAKQCIANDNVYIVLLSMAVINVFAVRESPKFISSSDDTKYLD